MADTITIPSPPFFLTASPVIQSYVAPPKPAIQPAKISRKRTSSTWNVKTSKGFLDADALGAGLEKKKQSKSRNGKYTDVAYAADHHDDGSCVTCKFKRLKCDETKPTCQQCARRNVDCGGYRKEYKWRQFGDTSFTVGRALSAQNKKEHFVQGAHSTVLGLSTPSSEGPPTGPRLLCDTEVQDILVTQGQNEKTEKQHPNLVDELESNPFDVDNTPLAGMIGSVVTMSSFPTAQPWVKSEVMGVNALARGHVEMPSRNFGLCFADVDCTTFVTIDLDCSISTPLLTPMSYGQHLHFENSMDDIEEIARHQWVEMERDLWVTQLPQFYPASMRNAMRNSSISATDMFGVPHGIDLPMCGPEMLTLRFDQQTCGILSVKDGPTENPWRTLIWPLARDSPALYHAIASMTSFHNSKHQPDMRVQGIDHMRASIEALANGIANMRFDTAIATTLALAFAESWDQHTSTGINHIKGAKILVNQALTRHRQVAFAGEELERLKFLCNAWVYMDVLARLTSEDDDESNDFDAVYSKLAAPFAGESHLDPLMGAASTLFPVIGRVANLVRRVRRCESNSPAVISHAMELKSMLQDWEAPSLEIAPEDPSIDIQHAIQTAEAYRWATLLNLHQAVPEIPSDSSVHLGKKVMIYLATVPLSSRTVIIHIYPLIAASCEAMDEEDRQWVRERWQSMALRMKIGVIDRCAEVVKEVWERRDAYERRVIPRKYVSLKRGSSFDLEDRTSYKLANSNGNDKLDGRKRRTTDEAFDLSRAMMLNIDSRKANREATSGEIDHEFTVRGRLHWLGVMKDWRWEVLLG